MFDLVIIAVGATVSLTLIGAAVWFLLHVDQKIKTRGWLLFSMGTGVQLIVNVWTDQHVTAGVSAAETALGLYMWWNRGGGDGLKRGFKKLSARLSLRLAAQFS